MKSSRFTAPAILLVALISPLTAGITFKPLRAQPGQSIRLITHSETNGGNIQRTYNGSSQNGSIQIIRDRELVWTFRDPASDGTLRGMVRVKRMTTSTHTVINDNEDKTTDTSPLAGKMFSMEKTPTGDWQFKLDGSAPHARMRTEIASLKTYLKRKWFPNHVVNLGDSWEFDPNWIKTVIHRDLRDAQTVGTMSLRQIRKTRTGEYAVIDVSVRSSGGDFSADGTESTGTVKLDGQIVVNLRTMLDESLELKGTVTTTTGSATQSTKVTLPIELKANKSFVRGTTLLR